jgi:hypothetical protein
MDARSKKQPKQANQESLTKGNTDMTTLNPISIQIIEALPHCTDQDLKMMYGRLTLNMYGADVSNECADFVINERNRREAIAA